MKQHRERSLQTIKTVLKAVFATVAALGLTAAARAQAAEAVQGCGVGMHLQPALGCVPNGGGCHGGHRGHWERNRVHNGVAYLVGGPMLMNAFSNMGHHNQPSLSDQQPLNFNIKINRLVMNSYTNPHIHLHIKGLLINLKMHLNISPN